MSRSRALAGVLLWTKQGLSNGSVGTAHNSLPWAADAVCHSQTNALGLYSNAIGWMHKSSFSTFTRYARDQKLKSGTPTVAQVQQAAKQVFRRGCSSGTPNPKKGFESYFPKNKRTSANGESAKKGPEPKSNGDKGKKGAKETKSTDGKQSGKEDWQSVYNKWENDPQFQNQSLLTLGLLSAMALVYFIGQDTPRAISFQEFKTKLLEPGYVEKIEVVNKTTAKVYVKSSVVGESVNQGGVSKFYFNIGSVQSFENKLEDAQDAMGTDPREHIPVVYVNSSDLASMVGGLLPYILVGGFLFFLNRQAGGGGGIGGLGSRGRGIFDVGKASITKYDPKTKDKVMFKHVAGCDEAKEEVMEFVHFLKNPDKYKDLGAVIPKGALLVGPPGTGKTLLAKATAGEAEVPFLSISGSDFMEMFVGVGPSRVRDLFAQARSQSPSIIFIDEIDAIGRARGRGSAARGNDERENTLNQLLVEMDGFATTTGVVVLAGTNRPDILDKALLRPGRFDRQITIDHPDVKGRSQIFLVHLAKLKLEKEPKYYAERLAALTPGFAGADIANVCNEAALVAARKLKTTVDMRDFEQAIDRTIGGLEKKNKVISKEERRTVAFHEAGHAVVGWFLEHTHPLLKVSIVPRGTAALGFAQYLPSENMLQTTEMIQDNICMTLGGRAAEQVMLGKISTGAQNDLQRVTQVAYSKVSVYGMNRKIGLLSFPPDENSLNKPYSDDTAQMIDKEVRVYVDELYEKTVGLVEEKKDLVEKMALALLDREVLNLDDIVEILGERPFQSEEMRNIDKYRHGFDGADAESEAVDSEKPDEEPATPPTGPDVGEPAVLSTQVPQK